MALDPEQLYPRDKDMLLREMDVRMRLSDIKRLHTLRERTSVRWWEPVFVILLFAAAVGLLASLYQYSELRGKMLDELVNPKSGELDRWILFSELQNRPLNKWLLFWFGIMILMTVMCFQLILIRIYNFRRYSDVLMRSMEDLRNRMDALDSKLADAMPAEPPKPPEPAVKSSSQIDDG